MKPYLVPYLKCVISVPLAAENMFPENSPCLPLIGQTNIPATNPNHWFSHVGLVRFLQKKEMSNEKFPLSINYIGVLTPVSFKDVVQKVCKPEFVPVAVRGLSALLSEYCLFEKRKYILLEQSGAPLLMTLNPLHKPPNKENKRWVNIVWNITLQYFFKSLMNTVTTRFDLVSKSLTLFIMFIIIYAYVNNYFHVKCIWPKIS